MKKYFLRFVILLVFFCSTATVVFAEGKPATELNKKVKVEGLSGLNLFLAETYNEDRLLFAVISTLSVVICGVIVTWIIGLIIKPHAITEKHE